MEQNNVKAKAALILGIISLLAWLLPLVGYPVAIVGIVMGAKGLNAEPKNQAMAGLILSIIGLVICVANSAIGAFMGANGMF